MSKSRFLFLLLTLQLTLSSVIFAQDSLLVMKKEQYAIFKNGSWVLEELDTEPVYQGDIRQFYKVIGKNIRYPEKARRFGIAGTSYVIFEVNTMGEIENPNVFADIGGNIDRAILDVLKMVSKGWNVAEINGLKYRSRFVLPLQFSLGASNGYNLMTPKFPTAYKMSEIVITAQGISRPGGMRQGAMRLTVNKKPTYNSLQEALADKKNCELLEIKSQNIKALPEKAYALSNLIALDIEENKIENLSDQISNFRKLKVLIANKNLISILPKSISSLNGLETLKLNTNNFQEFPTQILGLEKLKTLDLSQNYISSIPPEISNLKRLRTLILNDNNLTSLPNSLLTMKNIERIYLYGNNIPSSQLAELANRLPNTEIIF